MSRRMGSHLQHLQHLQAKAEAKAKAMAWTAAVALAAAPQQQPCRAAPRRIQQVRHSRRGCPQAPHNMALRPRLPGQHRQPMQLQL